MTSDNEATPVDGVRVAVRVRPLNERERALLAAGTNGSAGISWALDDTSMTQIVDKRPVQANSFSFDHVFLEGINNETVYKSLAAPVVLSAVEGINGVIFAYGQTAAGKTHTMLGNESDPGITRRSISDLFNAIAAARGRGFLLRASYIEIYNEVIIDLLGAGGENLKIHEDVVNKRVYVNAKEEVVTSVQDVMDMLAAGEEARAVGVTNMNERSSRSHTIFTLRIESREIHLGDNGAPLDDDDVDGVAVRASTLTLVDLAGSERVAFTKAEGIRLKEGGHINKSLLTLGTVISKLSSGESRSAAHVPYRDSKLTRILQPALGGNARTAIVCAVTPSLVHMDETLSTLRFASRAKKVTNHAQTNEYLDDRAKLRRAEKEIERLKVENAAIRNSKSVSDGSLSVSTAEAQSEVATALLEKNTRKRMKLFEKKFEKLITAVDCQSRTSSASAPGGLGLFRSSLDSKAVPEISADWAYRPLLREALDLRGIPSRRPSSAFSSQGSPADDEESEKGDADLRMRALQAENELKKALAEIEWERRAHAAEVENLVVSLELEQITSKKSQAELDDAHSFLASGIGSSIVDEVLEGAMMGSEQDRKIEHLESEIKRLEAVQLELGETSVKLAALEREHNDALKREKRGVGPVLKEKAALQSKLSDVESKFRGMREKVSKITSEKAAVEREIKGKEKQIKMLTVEVEKHRKKKDMADSRVAKEHADEKKKLESELEAAREDTLLQKGIIAAQKAKIEALQTEVSRFSGEIAEQSETIQKLNDDVAEKAMRITLSAEEVEKLRTELAEKEACLIASKDDCGKLNESVEVKKQELESMQIKLADVKNEHEEFATKTKSQIRDLNSEIEAQKGALQEAANKAAAENEELSGELADVHLQLEQFKAMSEASEKEVEKMKTEIDSLGGSLSESMERVEASETALAKKSVEIEELSRSLAECRTEVDIAQEEVKLRKDHMEMIEKALAESKISCGEKQKLLDDAQAKQVAAEKTFRELCEELSSKREKCKNAQEAVKDYQEQVSNLEKKFLMQRQQTETNADAMRQLEDVQITIEQEKCNLLTKVGQYEAELDTLRGISKEHEENFALIERLQTESGKLRQALNDRQSNIENCRSCKALSEELRALQRNVGEGLKHSTRGVKDAREHLERRSNELEAGMEKLVRRNEGLLREGQAAAREKMRLLESLQRATERTHKLEEKLLEYGRGEGAIAKLEKRVRRRDGIIATLDAKLAVLEGANEEVGHAVEWRSKMEVVELEAGFKTVQMEKERLETRLRNLEDEKIAVADEAHKLRLKIKEREAVWTNSLKERRERDLLELRRECQKCGENNSFKVRV